MRRNEQTRVIVFGGTGRMGSAVVDQLVDSNALSYAGLIRRVQHETCDDTTELEGVNAAGVPVPLDALMAEVDVAIDFSLPEAVERHASLCLDHGLPYVCGVTALGEATLNSLSQAAAKVPMLWAPNMSTGVTVCFSAAADIASRLGRDCAVDITDIHHAGKQDAPSGTALEFGRVIEKASPFDVEISYESVREGAHPGEHHIVFRYGDDQIELRHVASDRGEFAAGAIRAAQWLVGQSPGLYNLRNVLGITSSR